MKIPYITFLLLILFGCQSKQSGTKQHKPAYSFYVGTYTDTVSKGIYRYSLNEDGTFDRIGLATKTVNPSFLARSFDKKFLVAVNEIDQDGEGTLESYMVKGDSLVFMNRSSSGGAHPCFVAVNESGYILTANYTGGNVGLLRLNNQGEISDLLDLQQHSGSGTTDRQQGPHAHSAWFVPGSNQVISVDLGTNELWVSVLDTLHKKLIPAEQDKILMDPGAGPRHLVFHPNGKWVYVINELDCTITSLQKSVQGIYIKGRSVSTLPVGFTGENTCADIHISSDGKFLYASNRGHNSIAIYAVNAVDGSLKTIGFQSTHGSGPRNFALSPDEKYVLVANQKTNSIVSFKRDSATGLLDFVSQIESPNPVCILF